MYGNSFDTHKNTRPAILTSNCANLHTGLVEILEINIAFFLIFLPYHDEQDKEFS